MKEGGGQQHWLVDGRVFNRRGNVNRSISAAVIEMRDIPARLEHMDQLGVDVQVLYPSLFLRPVTAKVEVETALFRSYNRWMASVWKQGGGRLRWVAMVPLMDLDAGLEEAGFAKENGACGLFIRGFVDNRMLSDPYFFPLYAEALRLDLPICVHASLGNFDWMELFDGNCPIARFKMPVLTAFHCLALAEVPARFPGLRFGFIEVRAQWLPYLISDLDHRASKKGQSYGQEFMKKNNFYVACQTNDDMPWILKYAGEDHLVIGSDYGHADDASELEVFRAFSQNSEISPGAVTKILDDNARRLYGL